MCQLIYTRKGSLLDRQEPELVFDRVIVRVNREALSPNLLDVMNKFEIMEDELQYTLTSAYFEGMELVISFDMGSSLIKPESPEHFDCIWSVVNDVCMEVFNDLSFAAWEIQITSIEECKWREQSSLFNKLDQDTFLYDL